MRDDPGDLAYLVHAGAGVHEGHWPFEMGAQKGKGNGNQPHAYDQGIGVEDDVAAAVKDAVYDDGVYTAADHVKGHDQHHLDKVAAGLPVQFYKAKQRGNERKHDKRRKRAAYKGQAHDR